MIEYLRLSNFRRHENTEITLAEGEQTVVVSGRNGSGKSTIIEGIVYALLGEGRHGRQGLDRIVRRGAEIEGMEVELAFDIDGTKYRIVRRRDGKTASAVLSINGQPAVEGTKSVTAAVEDILGMDAQGVRLAIVAQQKELDALVKMGASTRVRAIGRLLRLDAIARARDEVRSMWRSATGVLDAMPESRDLVQLAREMGDAERVLSSTEAAEQACRNEIVLIEASLAASVGVEAEYSKKREDMARIAGEVATVASEVARLQGEHDAINIPAEIGSVDNTAVLERRGSELEHRIARAEAEVRVKEQREMLEREIARDTARREELQRNLEGGSAEQYSREAAARRAEAHEFREEADQHAVRREVLREELGKWRSREETARSKAEAVAVLGGVCEACGQEVSDGHRHTMLSRAEAEAAEASLAIKGVIHEGQAARDAYENARKRAEAAEEEARKLSQRAEQASGVEGELAETTRRLQSYTAQLARLGESGEVDVEGLYREKGALAVAVAEARAAADAARERAEAIERLEGVRKALEAAKTRLAEAEMRAELSAIGQELEKTWEERSAMLDRQRGEMAMLAALVEQTAEARQQVERVKAELRHANELTASRVRQQERGRDAANAQKLLDDVERTIGGAVRPGLESAVSDILCQMSQGRFTSVKVGADYDVTVLDDGSYRPIGELSGGEADLVALAIRLGVADVVCQRNGAIGFLILDEPFGSQDAERRESIVVALRALRSRYGQVWCISHVGGLDDVADRVIEVEVDEDGVSRAQ